MYGIPSDKELEKELKKVYNFVAKTGVTRNKLQPLFNNYNKIKELAKTKKLTIVDSTIDNLDSQALWFLHHFIRLANKLNWSFDKLGEVLITINNADNAFVAESLGLSPEEYKLSISTSSDLNKVYGASKSELENVEKFIAQTNMDYDKLEQLLDCNNKVKKLAENDSLSADTGTINKS